MAFVDTEQRPAGEVQQKVGRIKLSEAIRAGAEEVAHDPHRRAYRSCAIGAAHWTLHGERLDVDRAGYHLGTTAEEWAIDHGFDPKIARTVQQKFDHEGLSHHAVADWLEAQGL